MASNEEFKTFKKTGAVGILGAVGGLPAIAYILFAIQNDITELKKNIAIHDAEIKNIKQVNSEIKQDIKTIMNDIKFIRDRVK